MTRVAADERASVAIGFLGAFNDRDWRAMRLLLTDDCTYEEIAKPRRSVAGAGAVVEAFRAWADAAPELRGRAATVLADGDRVAIEVVMEGAVEPLFGDFSSAGRRPAALGSIFFAFEDRLVRELHLYFDALALFQVLGLRG